eukprot:CAMPEP_0172929846 /NCGR_PEP_ID=MMETSP1075-20121228/218691_1 /TAXON_ID=2916 /ORGANISM="Ceratium fusus, Strain PA161109" /LENGTH=634 /DNA_ID=CAMNT_0013791151 /DNA_START=24 /DNA_END=1925 /DNA_ORIENTATION=-
MQSAPLLQNDGLQAMAGPPAVLGCLHEGYKPNGRGSTGDQRVSLTPKVAEQIMKDGYKIVVETGAGAWAGFSDDAYSEVGCEVLSRSEVIERAAAPLLQNDGLQAMAGPPAVLGCLHEGYKPNGRGSTGDQRVSLTPKVAEQIMKDGYKIVVETGAGAWAGFSDDAYSEVGCEVLSRSEVIRKGQVLFSIDPPVRDFRSLGGKILISWIGRLQDKGKDLVAKATAANITLIDVTAVPRITIAQKLDVLSSQAKVAGHRAVVAEVLSRSEVIRKGQVLFSIDPPVRDFRSLGGKILISWIGRLQDKGKDLVAQATAANITLIDVTAVPRITIAQKLDVLSSQAKVAGHRAVVEATHAFGRFHTGEMTAAGKYPPSQSFVLGCGVAGLAAIGTLKALGSVVKAWDVRDVSDQCASMGAKWVTVDFKEDGAGAGGYAKESSDAFKQAQQATFKKVLQDTDIAITTAAIPGRRSPLLITQDAIAVMKPGSVIVDLAAVGGGNCELTKLNEAFTTENGVTIIGFADLPARMANQSSSMYAQNMANLLKHVQGKDKGSFVASMIGHLEAGESGDIVTRSIVCCRNGVGIKMPPPPQPTPTKPKVAPVAVKAKKAASPKATAMCGAFTLTIGLLCMVGMGE